MGRWIDARRDHLLAASGLRADACVPGQIGWLAP